WLKGRVLHRQGQYETAIWSYKRSLEFDPSNWGVYLDMGKAYTSMQQLDEAAQAYRSAERLAPASEQKQIRSLLTRLRR
ncbi:tetratricopeptide repeat protein, partial [bacterium]|nr:tetratricopeptide repeat protein [bacterium]